MNIKELTDRLKYKIPAVTVPDLARLFLIVHHDKPGFFELAERPLYPVYA